ncbi:FkbM family methyltransferase [Microlunatus elymi]|uniref:FkbM family methyltransferase n=1 Tax=Microlunatus elymi TaxID=2596828 RepID=A0A516PUW4_9ACTN|nr:FkbM family methyltransferase [Microlunatus elymi]QDP94977.1 FkbM family methyltransferase [Microlunatus elymi]
MACQLCGESSCLWVAIRDQSIVRGHSEQVEGPSCSSVIHAALERSIGLYEPMGIGAFVSALSELDPRIDLVWDIGANVGLYGALATSRGFGGVAIEANPQLRSILGRNLTVNAAGPKWSSYPVAVADRDGRMIFRQSSTSDASGSLRKGWRSVAAEIEVPTTTLDTIARYSDQPGLVKIDVEGCEHLVLRGAQSVLRRGALILVEVNLGAGGEEVLEILNEHGYTATQLDGGSSHQSADHSYIPGDQLLWFAAPKSRQSTYERILESMRLHGLDRDQPTTAMG